MQTKGLILKDYKEIKKVFEDLGVQKPFLCCGNSFLNTEIKKYLEQFNLVTFSNIRPNPRYEDMVDAAQIFNNEKCDFIIGAGGGSPLDSAKMIKLLATNYGKVDCLKDEMAENNIPFLAIPTTSGTGSEATRYSIFYVNENEKHSISHPDFLPEYVVLDEKLLKTVPLYQRRVTAMDALCHAIESYWNVKSTEKSKEFAKKAILLFFENKNSYLNNEEKGNKGMLLASYYAGCAIDITATTSAHAMCYNITMNCDVSHGHSVCLNLAKIWQFMLTHNKNINDNRGRDYVLKTFDELGVLMGGKTAKDGVDIFNSLISEFELFTPKAEKSLVDSFVSNVNVTRLLNNPTHLDGNDVKSIYYSVFNL